MYGKMYSLENYMPACRQCNFYKSTFDLETFRSRLTEVMIKNLQKEFNYKLAIKYGLIIENIKPVQFYFEKLNKEAEERKNEEWSNEKRYSRLQEDSKRVV